MVLRPADWPATERTTIYMLRDLLAKAVGAAACCPQKDNARPAGGL